MIKLPSNKECCGCSACQVSCPTHSIIMSDDDTLHRYPKINSNTCVECGCCMQVCPVLNETKVDKFNQKYYAAWNIDDTQRLKSTSGGLGYAFMKQAIEQGYYVCGVVLDNKWNVKHIISKDINDLIYFCGSKYVQSDTNEAYKQIVELIKLGEKIFYIGTPCQVEGLKKLIPLKCHNQLLTCAIICHGVNSPKVWHDYVKYMEYKNHSILINYNFRSKSHGWQKKNGGGNLRVAYQFKNRIKKDIPAWKNLYHHWFGHHYILRPSCVNCKFRNEQRVSDITIGDFWGVERIITGMDVKKGVSVLIISSQKGFDFIKNNVHIRKKETAKQATLSVLKGLLDTRLTNAKNEDLNKGIQFSQDYLTHSFTFMVKKYSTQTIGSRIFNFIKYKLRLVK